MLEQLASEEQGFPQGHPASGHSAQPWVTSLGAWGSKPWWGLQVALDFTSCQDLAPDFHGSGKGRSKVTPDEGEGCGIEGYLGQSQSPPQEGQRQNKGKSKGGEGKKLGE